MNSWSFTGNIGKDAETRFTPGGDAVVNFSVAVKSGYGDKEKTTWARCAAFGKRYESVSQYLTKGQIVGIVGEVTLREWEKDGAKHQSLEVRVNDLTLLGKREKSDDQPSRNSQGALASGGLGDFEDDIPFSPIGRGLSFHSI